MESVSRVTEIPGDRWFAPGFQDGMVIMRDVQRGSMAVWGATLPRGRGYMAVGTPVLLFKTMQVFESQTREKLLSPLMTPADMLVGRR